MNIKIIVKNAMIAAIYVVVSLLLQTLSFASVQIRIAELLMILCIFDKKYVIPLTLGCFLTNLVGLFMGINPLPLDIIVGPIATYLSGILMYRFKHVEFSHKPLLSLFIPCIINGLLIGTELAFYLNNNNFITLFISSATFVFIGEFISIFIIGILLYEPMKKLINYFTY